MEVSEKLASIINTENLFRLRGFRTCRTLRFLTLKTRSLKEPGPARELKHDATSRRCMRPVFVSKSLTGGWAGPGQLSSKSTMVLLDLDPNPHT